MKAKRRHDLQHNVLDTELGKIVDFLKRRATLLSWGLLLVLATILVGVYVHRARKNRALKPRLTYTRLVAEHVDPADKAEDVVGRLKQLAEQDDNEDVAANACLQVANLYATRFSTGAGKLSPAERDGFADQAASYYRRVLDRFPENRTAVAWAHLGLGKLAEGRSGPKEARSHYEAAAAAVRNGALAGYPVDEQVQQAREMLARCAVPVKMATTAPAPRAKQPATQPSVSGLEEGPKIDPSEVATRPATRPAGSLPPPAPATQSSLPR